jgi:hypothetical protein
VAKLLSSAPMRKILSVRHEVWRAAFSYTHYYSWIRRLTFISNKTVQQPMSLDQLNKTKNTNWLFNQTAWRPILTMKY